MPCLSLAKLERHLYSAADRLRQEGLDAATYKDYIFGMLFLKRCSDVYDAEREKIVGRKVEQGMALNDAETNYGENPDYYDGFFVPERARWKYLQDKLNDATAVYGSVLDIALSALSEANESLEHVLDHISFLKTQGTKRLISDDCCKDLVRTHFSRYRLRNEDFQFSDLLGAAYEFLINMFAESAGKKGGDFYTPRDVIRLMVRILKPTAGMAKRPLFDALGFNPAHAFLPRTGSAGVPPAPAGVSPDGSVHELKNSRRDSRRDAANNTRDACAPQYLDFAPALPDRSAIRPLVENDPGVQACLVAVRKDLAAWWTEHSPRLAQLPEHRKLNRVRAEFFETFVAALLPLNTLNRFKLAGVIATWWTETLPDFKTLLENGFPGVMDGWVDAIADAVEDDEAAGPVLDPFAHKLVRRTMTDYLERIAAAKADIARLKGEKEAFEQSNAPDDLDEEELENWNYPKDLERQMRELKAEHKEVLKALAKLEKAAAKTRATTEEKEAAAEARAAAQPVLDQLNQWEVELRPYEAIKEKLSETRARFRSLTAEFVNELKSRCDALNDDQKRALVLELFAQDVQAGLDAAVAEKRQELVRFIEGLWDKYRVTLTDVRGARISVEAQLEQFLKALNYAR